MQYQSKRNFVQDRARSPFFLFYNDAWQLHVMRQKTISMLCYLNFATLLLFSIEEPISVAKCNNRNTYNVFVLLLLDGN